MRVADRWMSADRCPGYPIVRAGDCWATFAGAEKTIESTEAPAGSFVFVFRGELCLVRLDNADLFDPASWVSLDSLTYAELEPVGKMPEAPRAAKVDKVKENFELLGQAGLAPSKSLRDFHEARAGGKRKVSLPFSLAGLITAPLAAIRSVSNIFSGLIGTRIGAKGSSNSTLSGEPIIPRPGPFDDLLAAASRFFYFFLLGGLLDRIQLKHFRDVARKFQSGDLEQALRSAVPLQGLTEAPSGPIRPSWSLFGTHRESLDISTAMFRPGSSMMLGMVDGRSLYDVLEDMYRKAFDRLDERGEVKKAAFVLAELLNDVEAAALYLERNGEARLAAELAEGRRASPGLICRLWFGLGEIERCLAVAKTRDAFETAVNLLEDSDPTQARALRLLWAKTLAEQGLYARAVAAVWGKAADIAPVQEWIDKAIELGGDACGTMWVRKLEVNPASYDALKPRVLALIDSADPLDRISRQSLFEALCMQPSVQALEPLIRGSVRAMLRDLGQGRQAWEKPSLRRMRAALEDRTQYWDWPADVAEITARAREQSGRRRLDKRDKPLVLEFKEPGAMPLFDAVPIGKGNYLIALGQAGSRVVNSRGKTVAKFREPAHEFVMSDAGTRAIAIGRFGQMCQLSRIDVESFGSSVWAISRLESWARTHFQSLWFVFDGAHIHAMDVWSESFEPVWSHKPEHSFENGLADMDASKSQLSYFRLESKIHEREISLEFSTFGLPEALDDSSLVYANRIRLGDDPIPGSITIRSDSFWVGLDLRCNERDELTGVTMTQGDGYAIPFTREIDLPNVEHKRSVIGAKWIALVLTRASDIHIHLLDYAPKFNNKIRATVILDGATSASVRFQDDFAIISDSTGRLIHIDLTEGNVIGNLRLS